MAQADISELLTRIVEELRGDLKAILIFELTEGCFLNCNKQLQTENQDLYNALWEVGKGAKATGLESIKEIQDALKTFGGITNYGELQYSIFKLKEGTMMVYFDKLPDTPVATCFISPANINLGNVVFQSRRKIVEISEALKRF